MQANASSNYEKAAVVMASGLVTLWLSITPSLAATYSFTTIDGPGANGTVANGINDNGEVVGTEYFAPANSQGREASSAFTLASGSFSTYSYPGAYDTLGFGLNNSGQTVGICNQAFYPSSGTCQLFLGVGQGWIKSGTSVTSPAFPGALPNATNAVGINDSGQVVGSYELPGGALGGYLLSNGTYTSFESNMYVAGINNLGQMLANDGSGGHLFSGVAGTVTTISVPGAYSTDAMGLNNLGEVVGCYTTGPSGPDQSFIWDAGVFSFFNDPLGANEPNVAGAAGGTCATGINDFGQIAGFYTDSSGVIHGFVATPTTTSTPEPATLAIFATGLAGLGLMRRRSRQCGRMTVRDSDAGGQTQIDLELIVDRSTGG
jgi:hypothetical protein